MKRQNIKFWGILTVIIIITMISSLVIPVMAAKPTPDPQPTTPQQKLLTAWYSDQQNSANRDMRSTYPPPLIPGYAQMGPTILTKSSTSVLYSTPKKVTFQGGGVSGSVAWENAYWLYELASYKNWVSSGSAPGIGYVRYTTDTPDIKYLALPITTPVTISGVTSFDVQVGAPIPQLIAYCYIDPDPAVKTSTCLYSNYAINVVGSVTYIEG